MISWFQDRSRMTEGHGEDKGVQPMAVRKQNRGAKDQTMSSWVTPPVTYHTLSPKAHSATNSFTDLYVDPMIQSSSKNPNSELMRLMGDTFVSYHKRTLL